eukprot:8932023-Alexandrium_andersonii.AAC.1
MAEQQHRWNGARLSVYIGRGEPLQTSAAPVARLSASVRALAEMCMNIPGGWRRARFTGRGNYAVAGASRQG